MAMAASAAKCVNFLVGTINESMSCCIAGGRVGADRFMLPE